jgi:RND family efflux transporter MFP subunit
VRSVLFLILLAGAAGAGLWWYTRPPEVSLAAPRLGRAVEAVYATGEVETRRLAEVGALVAGRIAAYPVSEGAEVGAGDLLIQLDDRTERAEVERWEAEVAFLEGDLARYRTLLSSSTVSRQTYDRIVSELAKARANLHAAQQRVDDMAIRAPFAGRIIRSDGEIGDVVDRGDVLIWLGSERPYRIEAQVDEEDLPRVALGQRALLLADAFPGEVMEGEVSEITPMGDPVNKQYRVRIRLPADSPLAIGMTTEVNIIVREEPKAILVPEAALRDGGVWIYDAGVARAREVMAGAYGDRVVEIREGLTLDDLVILDPPEGLRDGDEVRAASGSPEGASGSEE